MFGRCALHELRSCAHLPVGETEFVAAHAGAVSGEARIVDDGMRRAAAALRRSRDDLLAAQVAGDTGDAGICCPAARGTRRIGFRGVTGAAERERLELLGAQECAVGVRAAMERLPPLGRDLGVTAFAAAVCGFRGLDAALRRGARQGGARGARHRAAGDADTEPDSGAQRTAPHPTDRPSGAARVRADRSRDAPPRCRRSPGGCRHKGGSTRSRPSAAALRPRWASLQ